MGPRPRRPGGQATSKNLAEISANRPDQCQRFKNPAGFLLSPTYLPTYPRHRKSKHPRERTNKQNKADTEEKCAGGQRALSVVSQFILPREGRGGARRVIDLIVC